MSTTTKTLIGPLSKQDRDILYEAQWRATSGVFANQLVVLRLSRGLSIKEVAEGSKVPMPLLRKLESGVLDGLSLLSLSRLGIFFDVAPMVNLVSFSEALRVRLSTTPVASYTEEAHSDQYPPGTEV